MAHYFFLNKHHYGQSSSRLRDAQEGEAASRHDQPHPGATPAGHEALLSRLHPLPSHPQPRRHRRKHLQATHRIPQGDTRHHLSAHERRHLRGFRTGLQRRFRLRSYRAGCQGAIQCAGRSLRPQATQPAGASPPLASFPPDRRLAPRRDSLYRFAQALYQRGIDRARELSLPTGAEAALQPSARRQPLFLPPRRQHPPDRRR